MKTDLSAKKILLVVWLTRAQLCHRFLIEYTFPHIMQRGERTGMWITTHGNGLISRTKKFRIKHFPVHTVHMFVCARAFASACVYVCGRVCACAWWHANERNRWRPPALVRTPLAARAGTTNNSFCPLEFSSLNSLIISRGKFEIFWISIHRMRNFWLRQSN